MKRVSLGFSIGLFIVLLVAMLSQQQASIPRIDIASVESPVKPTLVLPDKQERARLSVELTKKIFSNYPEAAVPLDCFAQDKQGFMNTSGDLVVPICFDLVGPFSDGVAWVRIGKERDKLYFGFINREGVFVVPPILTFDQFNQSLVDWKFSENLLPLRREPKGKIGYINKTGEFVIEPQFDTAKSFQEGLAGVCWSQEFTNKLGEKKSRCGYIDLQGNVVVPPQFGYVRSFRNGLAVVQTIGDEWGIGRRLGIIDREGNYLVEPNLDFVNGLDRYSMGSPEPENGDTHSNLLSVRIPDSEFPPPYRDGLPTNYLGRGKWGYVRRTGGYVIEPRFSEATNFSEERAIVEIDKSDTNYPSDERGKEALIDTTGKIISTRGQNPQPILVRASLFDKGIAIAKAPNDRYGFLDRNGRWAIQPVFSQIQSFSEGLAAAKDAKSGSWGYIDQQGQWVIQPQFGGFSDAGVGAFSQGLAAVQDAASGKWGYVDRSGKFVIAPQFDSPFNSPFDSPYNGSFRANGLAEVRKEKQWGLINKQGAYLLQPKYASISNFINGIAQVELNDRDFLYLFVTESGQFLPYVQRPQGSRDFISEGLIAISGRLSNNFKP